MTFTSVILEYNELLLKDTLTHALLKLKVDHWKDLEKVVKQQRVVNFRDYILWGSGHRSVSWTHTVH